MARAHLVRPHQSQAGSRGMNRRPRTLWFIRHHPTSIPEHQGKENPSPLPSLPNPLLPPAPHHCPSLPADPREPRRSHGPSGKHPRDPNPPHPQITPSKRQRSCRRERQPGDPFLLPASCVALTLFTAYCFPPCWEDRIIHFLASFSAVRITTALSALQTIIN